MSRLFLRESLAGIILPIAVCGAFFIRAAAYQAFRVATDKMSPTLMEDQRVLVNKTVYDVEPMRRGDVVIVHDPDKPNVKLIRRLIALPGDKIEWQGGGIQVNGKQVWPASNAAMTQPRTAPATEPAELVVPKGYGCFAEDNPQTGPNPIIAPLAGVIGRAEVIYWPSPARVR